MMFHMVEKAINLIKLNVLWVLFSLPLVTGGAALCALHIVAVKILKNEEGYVFRDFWTVYKGKMKVSLQIWIPLLLGIVVLFFDSMFWRNMEGSLADIMRVFVFVMLGMWLALVFYVFPLAARMDTTAGTTYRNGILLLFKYLPQSMYLLFVTGIFLTAGILWTPVFYIMILAGGSLLAVIHGKMLLWIFEKEKIVPPEEG
ncbi:hypothetical protein C806_02560 [Lachnospiraceae bacterium 3-1]|nr:hypothetical protein C806_02560 [Lachnospiraceae bacterium 3-1]